MTTTPSDTAARSSCSTPPTRQGQNHFVVEPHRQGARFRIRYRETSAKQNCIFCSDSSEQPLK